MKSKSAPMQAAITRKQLRRADRAIPISFQLQLSSQEEPFYCDEIIRIIPKKRLVAFGTWKNQLVVAKLFYDYKAKHHALRDHEGVEALVTSGIPTPSLIYHGTSDKNRIQVLLFERILEADNLDVLWQQNKSSSEITELMKRVTVEIATQHVLGVIQQDLHLKNFLVNENHIYTLDGGNIDKDIGPLSTEKSLDNLGLFFAQLGVNTNDLQQELLQTYAEARGWILKNRDVKMLQTAVKKWNEIRFQRYQKKIFRNCTAFVKLKLPRQVIMYDRKYDSTSFRQFLNDPDMFLTYFDSKVLKSGRSSTVAKIKIDEQFFVLKRYNIKSFSHWLRRCLRRTRAAKSWGLAHRLFLAGISTPKPIAFIENRFLGLRGSSYFLMEHVDGMDLGTYFSAYQNNEEYCDEIAKRVIILFNDLAKLSITHGDLKMTNILIENEHPILIDLDGMQEHKNLFSLRRAFKKELNRFMENWRDRPNIKKLFEKLLEL